MAESPAQLHAEIEKYQQKHDENPEGRYFVPLANAYRKLGEFDVAESLLRDGLRRHPEYLSAHIVLGRTLADRGDASEATAEFRHVLGIDPQNLIALRSLGELSAVGGKDEEAGHWYRELLAVDPMNEEARQALAELEGPGEDDAATGFESAAPWWQTPGLPDSDGPPSGISQEAVEPESVGDLTLSEAEEPLEGTTAYGLDWSLPVGPAEEPEREEPEAAAELTLDWDVHAEISTELGDQSGSLDIDDASGDLSSDESFALSTEWGTDAQSADRGHEPAELHADFADTTADFTQPGGWLPEERPMELDAEPAEELAGEESDNHLVTETMAELYASQGFRAEAAEMYRELVRRRGEQPALMRRLAELEDEGETEVTEATDLPELTLAGTDSFAESFRNGFSGPDGEGAPADLILDEEEAPAELAYLPGTEALDLEERGASLDAHEDEEEPAIGFGLDLELAPSVPVEVDADEAPEPEALANAEIEADTVADVEVEVEALAPAAEEAVEVEPQATVAEFFAGLLAWRPARAAASPERDPEPEPEFTPTVLAQDEPQAAESVAPHPVEETELLDPARSAADDSDDDLFPWELPVDTGPATEQEDASPAVAESGQEPAAIAGPTAEQDEEPAPAPTPERSPDSPPQAAAAPADEDDDDLESFQAWLRSLKR